MPAADEKTKENIDEIFDSRIEQHIGIWNDEVVQDLNTAQSELLALFNQQQSEMMDRVVNICGKVNLDQEGFAIRDNIILEVAKLRKGMGGGKR